MGSSAEVGSSRSSTSGPTASARARQSSCCWPPERRNGESPSRSFTASHRPTSREPPLGDDVELLALGDAVRLDPGDHVVADGHREGVRPLEQHADPAAQREQVAERDQMLSPSRVTSPCGVKPGTRSFIRLSVRRKVDLPEPVGPMSAVMAPRLRSTSTSLRTTRRANPRVRLMDRITCAGRANVRVERFQGVRRYQIVRRLLRDRDTSLGGVTVSHYLERSESKLNARQQERKRHS